MCSHYVNKAKYEFILISIDAETTAIMYYAQFRVPGLDYKNNYGVDTSDEYAKLANEVNDTVSYA